MKKSKKIIIAVVLSVLFIAGLALGLFFGLKDKDIIESTFAKTGSVNVIDAETIEFSYLCPYMNENTKFDIVDDDGFFLSYAKDGEEKEIDGEIVSSKYKSSKTDTLESGNLVLRIELEEKIEENITYKAVIEENSIKLKKADYINPEITAEFSVSADESGKLEAEDEKYSSSKAAVPANAKADIVKENGKSYFIFTADIDGVTEYDKDGMANFSVYAGFHVRIENQGTARWANTSDDAEISVNGGKVSIKYSVKAQDLYPGKDYTYIVSKGFFTNDDKSVINDEIKGEFTYVEK